MTGDAMRMLLLWSFVAVTAELMNTLLGGRHPSTHWTWTMDRKSFHPFRKDVCIQNRYKVRKSAKTW